MLSKIFEKVNLDLIKIAQFPPFFFTLVILAFSWILAVLGFSKVLASMTTPLSAAYPWAPFLIFSAGVFGCVNMLWYIGGKVEAFRKVRRAHIARASFGVFILGLSEKEKKGLGVLMEQANGWSTGMFGEKPTEVLIAWEDPFATKLVRAGILTVSPTFNGQNNAYWFDRKCLDLLLYNEWLLEEPPMGKKEAMAALQNRIITPKNNRAFAREE